LGDDIVLIKKNHPHQKNKNRKHILIAQHGGHFPLLYAFADVFKSVKHDEAKL
jgi:hypothetical protein